jgi:transposase
MGSERTPGRPTTRRYSQAEKDQAVRLVRQLQAETGKRHGAIQRVAAQLGYGVESVRQWVKRAEIDAGEAPGTTSEDEARIRELEQEVRELRRANATAIGVLRYRGRVRRQPKMCWPGVRIPSGSWAALACWRKGNTAP